MFWDCFCIEFSGDCPCRTWITPSGCIVVFTGQPIFLLYWLWVDAQSHQLWVCQFLPQLFVTDTTYQCWLCHSVNELLHSAGQFCITTNPGECQLIVIQMFSLNRGDEYLPSTLPSVSGSLFWSVIRRNTTNELLIKVCTTCAQVHIFPIWPFAQYVAELDLQHGQNIPKYYIPTSLRECSVKRDCAIVDRECRC
jgi:hypothetical protein